MMNRPDRKICLITGATSGIGQAAALALAKMDFRVIIVGRDGERTARTRDEIRRTSGNEGVDGYVCDLSLVRDVRGLASRIEADCDRIDVLINNAGARFLKHRLTGEGVEMTLATNHLGHFVLTLSLIGRLKRSAGARIINVASGAHRAATGLIENIPSPKAYDGRAQYANSKLANVLFTYALADKLKGSAITVNAVDPGGVATNFARNNGWIHWLKHRMSYWGKKRLLTPAQGADTVVYLATSADVGGVSARYYKDRREIASSELSRDGGMQDGLWAASIALSGFDGPLPAGGEEGTPGRRSPAGIGADER